MIRLLDESLEEFLRGEVPLRQGEIDVAFETPDKTWSAGITQPTLSVFLWDVRRSAHEARSGRISATGAGTNGYKLAPPRVACRYHLTAWASDPRDEHRILSSVLATLLPLRTMPPQYLKGALAASKPPPDFRTGTPHVKDFVDFWSALQGKVKAGIDLVVTITIDSGVVLEAGPPIGSSSARSSDTTEPDRISESARVGGRVTDPTAVGAVVRSASDAALVGDDGTFWIDAAPGEEITVDTDPPKTATVPDSGPVWVED